MIEKTLKQMGYAGTPISIRQFPREEDESLYDVWRVDYPEQSFVLKKAKGQELELYKTFFREPCAYTPRLYATANSDDSDYILMEYIPGADLMHCNRKKLSHALDSLIDMQRTYWMADDSIGSYDKSLDGRQNRVKYLHNQRLEAAYNAYLQEFTSLPRTLCHDDLLPFNVIVSDCRAVFIDWEVGGILPYPTSLARLIAHGEETENALFIMCEEDKSFAIDYYFDRFIKGQGISFSLYRRSLDLFLFHEYCEWIYVGHKYCDTDNDRFRKYLQMATNLAVSLGF